MASASSPVPAAFSVRRVVAGLDDCGGSVFVSDGAPPRTVAAPTGHGVCELLWLDAMPSGVRDGGDPPPDKIGAFPSGGALACRVIRLPGFPLPTPVEETWLRMAGDNAALPGWHRSETLDLMVVLDGHITLGLEDGEYPLGPGDTVIQRGTAHRWRVVGPSPCTYLSVLLAPDPSAADKEVASLAVPSGVAAASLDHRAQRLVTATAEVKGSFATALGPVSSLAKPVGPAGIELADLWQTGGSLAHVEQGGDVAGSWTLEPVGGGVAFRRAEFAADADPGARRLHATDSIDVGVVVSGVLELGLQTADGELVTTRLQPGDAVVQRGAVHRWDPVGPDPAVLVSAMISVQHHPLTARM